MQLNNIYTGDAAETLRTLPAGSVNRKNNRRHVSTPEQRCVIFRTFRFGDYTNNQNDNPHPKAKNDSRFVPIMIWMSLAKLRKK
jgi:hypothetical protein